MKQLVRFLVATLCVLISTSTAANPLVLRCIAETSWGTEKIIKRIDIVLPDKTETFIVSTEEKESATAPLNDLPFGIGQIEVTEVLGAATQSHKAKFVVTQMPGAGNSLVGFYVVGSYVNSIRAELWEPDKPFKFFDTYNHEVLNGTCQ